MCIINEKMNVAKGGTAMDTATYHKEGELYKVINAGGRSFEIRYGYYEEFERESGEPIPIYPDFTENPLYNADGLPFATRTQDACICYRVKDGYDGEGWCADCVYYPDEHEEIGICRCEAMKHK